MTVNESDTEGDIIYQTGQGWQIVGEPPQAIPGPQSIETYESTHTQEWRKGTLWEQPANVAPQDNNQQ